jgi:hypothetical protein
LNNINKLRIYTNNLVEVTTRVSKRSMYFGDGWGGDNSFSYERFSVDYGVESVDGVGGVFNSTSGAVRVDERVAALDDISAAAFNLVLGVSGQTVLDVISERVLWVGVVLVSDYGFGDGDGGSDSSTGIRGGVGERGSDTGNWGGVGQRRSDTGNWGSTEERATVGTVSTVAAVGDGSGGEGGWGTNQTGASVSDESAEDDELSKKIFVNFDIIYKFMRWFTL